MTDSKDKADSSDQGAAKKHVPTILVILVLSLATWYFFHLESMPLTAAETTFVVGIWVVVVPIVKWLLKRLNRNSKSGVSR